MPHDRRTSYAPGAYGPHLPGQSYRNQTSMNGLPSPVENMSSSFHQQSRPDYAYAERSQIGIPPSLWMSPASTTPSSPSFSDTSFAPLNGSLNQLALPPHLLPDSVASSSSASTYSTYTESSRSTAPTTASSPQSTRKLSDLFADDLFSGTKPSSPDSTPNNFTSPRVSGSPDLQAAELAGGEVDPEKLAKEDPLATQVWRMYAKTKAGLPHGQRMENLTWRMMALALKKKKEDEERVKIEQTGEDTPLLSTAEMPGSSSRPAEEAADDNERGRSKGKTKVRVVGFDGTNQDGIEDTECVPLIFYQN